MRLCMLQKNFSAQIAVFSQLPYPDNLVIEKIHKGPENNKLNKTACLKKEYVSGIFQYHATHDVSVYAIDRHNGYHSIPVLIC